MDLESAEVERRNFRIRRRGFDRGEVTLYLHQVASAMEQLEEAAYSAERRVGELERDVRDLHRQSENGFHQAVASGSLTDQESPSSADVPSPEEVKRLIAAAAADAARLRKHAETILQDTMATKAQIIDEQARLLAEAKETAEVIIGDAKEAAADTRSEAKRFAEELRELTAAETIELVSYAKAMAAAILEAASREEVLVSVAEDDVTIDLREAETPPEPGDVEWVSGPRPSEKDSAEPGGDS